eukprot:1054308-Rhodomonas_salina.1
MVPAPRLVVLVHGTGVDRSPLLETVLTAYPDNVRVLDDVTTKFPGRGDKTEGQEAGGGGRARRIQEDEEVAISQRLLTREEFAAA